MGGDLVGEEPAGRELRAPQDLTLVESYHRGHNILLISLCQQGRLQ
jgi:hypothetical protein